MQRESFWDGLWPVAGLSLRAVVLGAMTLGVLFCSSSGDEEFADRMAAEHADDRPVPGAAAGEIPVDIVEEAVTYANVDGVEISGFLARPAEAVPGAPGILVIQEWWGLNDNIRSMARKLAGEGYVALAVDLYEGDVAEEPGEARELMTRAMANGEGLQANLRQARTFLSETAGAGKVGVIGWCFGGGWSLMAALDMPGEIDATVIYYGRLVTDPERLARLEAPILGIFGSEDRGIPLESVREFESALAGLGKQASIHVYEGANHAFANPSGTMYDEVSATDAWGKTLAFLDQNLGS